VHEEVVKLDQDFGATFSGMLTDDEGHVRALWGSYAEQVRSSLSQCTCPHMFPLMQSCIPFDAELHSL
jgi:hypothetical protein